MVLKRDKMNGRFLLLVMIFSVLLLIREASAQRQYWHGKSFSIAGKKIDKTRGVDNNIKTTKPANDIPSLKPEKSAGALCEIYLNNLSGYTVDIYVDGDWSGTIAAYNSQYFYTSDWKAIIYIKSVGGNYSWGPEYVECDSEYKWVNPE